MNLQNSSVLTDKFIDIRGYKTRYWDIGSSDSVVVLLHGFSLSCELWEQNIHALSKHHRVIALDFWGAGKTEATPNKVDLYDYPEFVLWFLEALNIKKAKFVGHSLGGLLLVRLAHMYPEYVEKLMLVGSAGFTRDIPLHFRLFSLPLLGEWLARPNLAGLHHAFKYNVHAKDAVPKEYIDTLFKYSQKQHGPTHALNLARSGIGFFGFHKDLIQNITTGARSLKCPVMVIWGKNDRIVHHKGALQAKKLIPHAQVEILDNCGHLPQIEYPDRFNELAHEFLRFEKR